MSKIEDQALDNAGEIIERFGGIRPMAAKISTPVTTVQGWKKRDVIPATRRDQILEAASENNIDLSDIVKGADFANQNVKTEAPTKEEPKAVEPVVVKPSDTKKEEPKKEAPVAAPVLRSEPRQKPEEPKEEMAAKKPAPVKRVDPESHESLMAAIESNSRRTMMASAWIATGLILLTFLVTGFLLWPSMKENNAQIDNQSEKIVKLESEVKDVNMRTSFVKKMVPENIQKKMDELQVQAQNIQTTVNQLSDRANEISSGVLGADAGPLSQRLAVLEEKMAELSGTTSNFGGLIDRIRKLEDTVPGQEQLKSSVAELQNMVSTLEDSQGSLSQNLAMAQNDAEGALGQTLDGVSGNDLKAAAMLIAFSQLRDSLNRNEPFENDLVLLQKLAGPDDVELQQALTRLAPHAEDGVLTAGGLSNEFKGLAGDIVVASLKGEDVSFAEKAKARMNKLFNVKKEGELVSGTETQVAVAKAQKMLDEGNIQGAIAQLQTLDGEAAQKAQPFIQQAEVSLLAEKAQQMLGENILSKLSGAIPMSGVSGQGVSFDNFDMNEVKRDLEKAVPMTGSHEVIRDDESGITILPSQSGFKGFSAGQ